jgi:hypothetical protein
MAGEQNTEVVFIEFQTDLGQLETATDILERTGNLDKKTADAFKKTNAEIQKRASIMANVANATQQASKKELVSIKEVHNLVNKMFEDFVIGFQEGIVDALKEAGLEFDEFGKLVNRNGSGVKKETNALKAELADVVRQMQQLKVAGEDDTEVYIALTKRAGELKDAMGDVAAEINVAAANSQALEGLLGIATGITAGFAVAQGTMALFGAEGEELQEVLLKVNAVMATLQGLQAIQAALQKESAANLLLLNIQQRAQNANLILENALQSQSIIVRTGAAVAQRALNAAMAANPIGIVVVALTGLIALLATYGRSAALARQQTSNLNVALGAAADAFQSREAAIRQQGESAVNALENEGAVRSRIAQQEIITQGLLADARRQRLAQLQQLLADSADAELEQRQKLQVEISRLLDQEISDRIEANQLQVKANLELRKEQLQDIADNLEARLAGARKNSAQELALAKQLARARADVELNEAGQDAARQKLIRANLLKELRVLDLNYARLRQEDRIAETEAALIKEQQFSRSINERTSQAEIDLQKRVIAEKAQLDLMQEGLTANQRLRIIQQSLQDQAELQRNFNQTVTRETLEGVVSRNNKALAALNVSNDERLRLTEENIIATAQIEIEAAQGLNDKIKEIEAKRNADLREARRANIDAQLQYELQLADSRQGVLRRANERIVQSDRATFAQRIAAINQLAALEIEAINKKQNALDDQLAQGLISQQEYNLRYAQLKDEELAITERTEDAKNKAIEERHRRRIGIAIQVAQQILDTVQQFNQQELDEQRQLIDAQRQEIQDLLDTGAITEKEAERRQKKLDLEERRLRRQQAQREKEFATYKALLAIPQAYLQGLVQGGPILGAIYAGLAAAQAILIASRQPPKFGVGKKHLYEGPAEVGHGSGELMQTDDGMYYVKKPTIVWVNKHDKVYSPTETARMLQKPSMQVGKYTTVNNNASTQAMSIDYEKLGIEVGKNIPKVGFNFDAEGFTVYQQGKNSFDKYLGQRRSF